jgi:imidazole glycerol-phosphate synthase subunit HisF
VTSVDRDGTRKGMDIELLRGIRDAVSVPVVASSGAGTLQHILHTFSEAQCDGVAMGAGLHWGNFTMSDIRAGCHHAGLAVRELESHDA